ncbi:uncharacterized protein ACDP82_006318 [Pangshura tecta]
MQIAQNCKQVLRKDGLVGKALDVDSIATTSTRFLCDFRFFKCFCMNAMFSQGVSLKTLKAQHKQSTSTRSFTLPHQYALNLSKREPPEGQASADRSTSISSWVGPMVFGMGFG